VSNAYTSALAQQVLDFNSVNCQTAFFGTSYVAECPNYANNWELAKAKVFFETGTTEKAQREIFVQLFEYKGIRQYNYPFYVDKGIVLSRLTGIVKLDSSGTPGYMDTLWSSY
nr:hypothetical protein [Candidatus Obscuribacter sp.]